MALQMYSPTKMDRGNIYIPSEEQLWHAIDHSHICYLEVEESLRKIEEKQHLEDLIKEYLSIVPHEKKFQFPETAQVLHKSVERIEDFSPYRTTAAWTALANYAHNLFAQPWRKEFREIKTYSGFYKHNVETSLFGGELILQLMGYQPSGQGTMILQGSVDPRRATMVSKDAFIALVECQIMRTIFEGLVKYTGDFTWFDVLQYREAHICSPEEAVKNLLAPSHHPYYSYRDMSMYKYSLDPMSCQSYCYNPSAAQQSMYTMQATPSAYGTYMQPQPMASHYPLCSNNGYYPTPHASYQSSGSMRPFSCSVPTAQLIELEPCSTTAHHKRSSSDVKDRSSRHTNLYDDCARFKSKDDKPDHYWTYGGYGRSTNTNYQSREDYSELDPSGLMQSLCLTDASSQHDVAEPSYSKQDVYSSSRKKPKDYSCVDSSSAQFLVREKNKKPKDNTASINSESKSFWECCYCTYHNSLNLKVCEMCNRSRSQGNEIQPLISGGSECTHCTLVNEKGVKECAACKQGLENSPTYI